MAPTTFLGLALFVAFIIPGYMWVRVEERARPRPDRSPLLEAAELVAVGALASTVAAGLAALLGAQLRPLLNVQRWIDAPEPSAYLQANALRAVASLLFVVILANLGTYWSARLRFGRSGRLQSAHTPWYDTFRGFDTDKNAALVSVEQANGVVLTGLLRSYDVTASGNEQVLALQGPIKRQRPGERTVTVPADFVVLPPDSLRAVYIAKKPLPKPPR